MKSHKPTLRPQLHPHDFGPHWNHVYYDILQEIYWDPKMIGRAPANPPVFANDREMLANLRRTEVSLNHILSLFFSLAPQSFISGLEKEVFGDSTDKTYRSVGIFELRQHAAHDPTQPDVFMASSDTCFSIEVKIGAKSDLEQIVKYALLHCSHGKRSGTPSASRLLYLTPRPVGKTWKERFSDIPSVEAALDEFDFEAFLKKTKMNDVLDVAALETASRSMLVGHVTFARFFENTKQFTETVSHEDSNSDSARKLIAGLLHELEFRRDVLKLDS